MTFTQVLTPNPNIPCWPGWCLQYVNDAFGVPAVYGSATDAWIASGTQHRDRDFPSGVWVPVWYSLDTTPLGHVVLLAPDGSVYSTSDLSNTPHHHPDLADLEAYYAKYGMTLTYRGWTEDVEGTHVIAGGALSYQATIIIQELLVELSEYKGEESMRVLATNGVDPQVWLGDGLFRRPVWSMDTVKNLAWLDEHDLIGPLYKDGAIQTIPDLNAIGIDVMALVGKSALGR